MHTVVAGLFWCRTMRLPNELRDYLAKIGREGGKKGGKAKGRRKVRGDAEYYRKLRRKRTTDNQRGEQ